MPLSDNSLTDIKFIDAQLAYYRGDPRKLAEFAQAHDLTDEQKAFVAAALLGDVPQVDGRTYKRATDEMVEFYEMMKRRGRPDVEVFRMLAAKYGLAIESVRRTISRAMKRRANPTS